MICGHTYPLGIMNPVCLGNVITNLALMTDGVIKDREERLAELAILPVGLTASLAPHLTRLGEVIVLLGIINAVVAGCA